jgi:hypothetical protein
MFLNEKLLGLAKTKESGNEKLILEETKRKKEREREREKHIIEFSSTKRTISFPLSGGTIPFFFFKEKKKKLLTILCYRLRKSSEI